MKPAIGQHELGQEPDVEGERGYLGKPFAITGLVAELSSFAELARAD